MTKHIFIILTFLLISCENAVKDKIKKRETQSNNIDTLINTKALVASSNEQFEDTLNYDFASYYVLVADTNQDYFTLQKKMFDLNKKFNIPIDTLGRFYNKSKNLIALPENDEDEIYSGDYFPKRFPSNNMSLEYLDFYYSPAGKKTIALVIGIFEKEENADSVLSVLNKLEKKIFKMKSDNYVGCIH
jgi:hypothetical protein